ncbi:MAG: Rpn family recombination-promoting nuclease/putative transposase [Lachnospiraceae bacterium]|nr:Rpn family recombination-promoting nuclease/putative transposase [Lachnospiraceae bacterium]
MLLYHISSQCTRTYVRVKFVSANVLRQFVIDNLFPPCYNQSISVTILNPIVLGEYIDNKDFILDIRCLLNDNTIINLEMQVVNQHNWPERSLSYLCRSFDNLQKGEDYIHVKTAIQIGILDFTLFPDVPEFYATYMMTNIKNHQIYSSKLRLSVLDLTHIDLATKEDRLFHIDYWASLFKATTWEEIKMLAQKDSMIKEASDTILQLSQDEQIRQRCEARADYLFWQRVEEEYKKELEENYQKAVQEKQQLADDNQKLEDDIQKLENENREKDLLIAQLQAQLDQKK